jgi:DNA cross-link repair 1A protein
LSHVRRHKGLGDDCIKCRNQGKFIIPIPKFALENHQSERDSKHREITCGKLSSMETTDVDVEVDDNHFAEQAKLFQPRQNLQLPVASENTNDGRNQHLNQQLERKIINGDQASANDGSSDSELSDNLTLAQIRSGKSLNVTGLKSTQTSISINDDQDRKQPPELSFPIQVPTKDASISEELPDTLVLDDHRGVATDLTSATTCFICGCSFHRITTGYRGRVQHMKRCSKKNGVTAHVMRLDMDSQEFPSHISPQVSDSKASSFSSSNNPTNPYANNPSTQWHAGAEQLLKLSETQQASITTFFRTTPFVKSINNVLMASAKRIAKTGEIILAAAASKKNNKRKRQEGSNSFSAMRYNTNIGKKYQTPCPYYKKIPGTDFICDGFAYADSSLTKNYFLTHFHSDHYGGIVKSWNSGIIYCSLPTANLVSQQLGVDRKFIHPLGMNIPVVLESKGKPVTVTLLDANHCPGAVMFLFQVGYRNILHVGDFRWNRTLMYHDLKDFFTQNIRLDDLFLDTTYCDEKYCLPTQDEAIEAAISKAEAEVIACRKAGKRLLMLFGAYTIGKERIYLAVAEKLGMKVYVDSRRRKILSALGWSEEKLSILTTDRHATSLWVVPLGHINFKHFSMYCNGSDKVFSTRSFDKVVGFRPTGWSLSGCKNGEIISTQSNGIFTVHGVPYSEHSSFPELVDCIECLRPSRIIPTVSVSKSEQQVALLLGAVKNKTS